MYFIKQWFALIV